MTYESDLSDIEYDLETQWRRYSRLTLQAHKATIHSIRWSPDGSFLASGGKDKMVHIHRMTESDLVLESRYTQGGHAADIDQISWNPTDPTQLCTASQDRTIKFWDIRSIDPRLTVKLKNENITCGWSADGHTIAVVDRTDLVSFLDVKMNYKVVKDLKLSFEVGEIAWNVEGDLLYVTSGDGKIHIYNYPELQEVHSIDAFSSPCVCIRFNQTGDLFAVGSNDAVSTIWDTENLACIKGIERLEWPIKAVSFSHDSKFLASGSEDHFIDIAKVPTGEQATTIEVSSPTVTLDFHPKQHILAYALDEREYRDLGSIKVVGIPEKIREERRERRS